MDGVKHSRIKNRAIAAATIAVIAVSVWVSFVPDYYHFFHHEAGRAQWQHPTAAVLIVCALYLAEAFFIAKATRLDQRLWLRASLAAVLFLPWLVYSTMTVMHAPPFWYIHMFWTWLLELVLLLVAAGTICSALRRRWRGAAKIA
jgi:hypothetical protein